MPMSLPRLGRRANLIIASGYGILSYYNNSKGLEKIAEKLEEKENDKAVPVPLKIQNLITQVLNEMKLKEEVKANIKPFLIKTVDLIHLGCPYEKAGAFLGVPPYYLFDQNSDVKFTVMVVKNETLTNMPKTNFLKTSVLLSEEAKKFGIAQEIYQSLNENLKLTAALPLLVMLNFNFLSYVLEKLKKPLTRLSFLPHGCIFIIGAFTYALISDIRSVYIETLSDFQAGALNKSYLQGGIEYYEKMILRNKALKQLNKNAPISEDGDINTSFFRTYHMRLARRLIYLKDLKKEMGEKPTPWDYVFYPQ